LTLSDVPIEATKVIAFVLFPHVLLTSLHLAKVTVKIASTFSQPHALH